MSELIILAAAYSPRLSPLMSCSALPIAQALIRFVIHLRLKFTAILAPIFLWGAFVSGGTIGKPSFALAFILFHLCLYGGVNALNTYYDRDEGPIGGLKRPPKVDQSLFYLAWGVQVLGYLCASTLPFGFRLIYLIAMAMSVAYSHPSIRLKGNPVGSVLIVAIGQGWLTYWAGWIASGVEAVSIFTVKGILGGLAVTLITVGLYPLTQVYQIDSDRESGDLTLAVRLGARRAFQFALTCIIIAGACMVAFIWLYVHWLEGVVLVGYFVGLGLAVYRWGRNYATMSQMENYDTVMRLTLVNSLCFMGYLGLHFGGIL
jgi:1,4-dihydroxy-2-naphthoate octaprenyltransferase